MGDGVAVVLVLLLGVLGPALLVVSRLCLSHSSVLLSQHISVVFGNERRVNVGCVFDIAFALLLGVPGFASLAVLHL